MRVFAIVGILCVVIAGWSLAWSEEGEMKATKKPDGVASFGWLAGTWRQENGDSVWEEHWLAPRGNSVAAVTRWVREGRTRLFELSAIEKTEKGTFLSLRHFGGGLKPSGPGSQRWRLLDTSDPAKREAVFEDPEQEFPRRIVYRRPDDDHLEVRLEGKIKGEAAAQGFRFTRVTD